MLQLGLLLSYTLLILYLLNLFFRSEYGSVESIIQIFFILWFTSKSMVPSFVKMLPRYSYIVTIFLSFISIVLLSWFCLLLINIILLVSVLISDSLTPLSKPWLVLSCLSEYWLLRVCSLRTSSYLFLSVGDVCMVRSRIFLKTRTLPCWIGLKWDIRWKGIPDPSGIRVKK